MKTDYLYSCFLDSAGVTTDSRVDAPGKIFFALSGINFDGHAFVEKALNGGCYMAVIDNVRYAVPGKTILVDDVLTSLHHLACHHRRQFNIPVLAITGSNGKTTSKELISLVLSQKYCTLATRGNLNNHIGVPLTLLELNASHQIAVIEMGANHAGEISMLCRIAEPDYGLITNIGSAHLEGFGSLEGVLKAKSELFVYLKRKEAIAFLNYDQINLREVAIEMGLNHMSFGRDENLYVSGSLLDSSEMVSMEFKIKESGLKTILSTRLTGSYNFDNILSAVCIGIFFGISPEQVKIAVESYSPGNNRSQIFHTGNNKLLLDAYNANPDSMKAAIKNFSAIPGGNKVAILGDMLELGEYAAREHQKIIELLENQEYNEVLLVGEIFNATLTHDRFRRFKNVDNLIEWLRCNNVRDRFILLKGSRGIMLEKCITLL